MSPKGSGVVDRLYNLIQIFQFDFDATLLGDFDYKMLMYNEEIPYGEKEKSIVFEFRKASSCLGNVNGDSLHDEDSQYWLQIKKLRKDILQYGSVQYITDVLIRGLFGEENTKRKSAFWACFGDVVYENLFRKVPMNTKLCANCGRRFRTGDGYNYCDKCKPLKRRPEVMIATCIICGEPFKTRNTVSGAICPVCQMTVKATAERKKYRDPNVIICSDCGSPFKYSLQGKQGRPPVRCSRCQQKRNREKIREWKIKHRA